MIIKVSLLVFSLSLLATSTVFARGEKFEKGKKGGRHHGWEKSYGKKHADRDELSKKASTYEGTLSLAAGRKPILEDSEGKKWYLLISFPIDPENLPTNGASISVEAIEIPMRNLDWIGTEAYLKVFSAVVDGTPLLSDWPQGEGMGEHSMMHRGMMHRGMMHRGMMHRGMMHRGMMHRGMMHRGMMDQGMMDQGMMDQGMMDQGMMDQGMMDQGMMDQGMMDQGI